MKTNRIIAGWIVIAGLLLGPMAGAAMASARGEVDVGYFHERLSPYGHWVQHRHHGWVWYPRMVPIGWRPYTYGHWVFTDEYGWMWVSDWEWGWAPFHYGRWAFDDEYGWVWVPGTMWGPAWVAWRTGRGFIGWAPLPPGVIWDPNVGGFAGGVDWGGVIARPAWVFVEERVFVAPRVREYIVLPARNVTIINQTKIVNKYVFVNRRIVNHSISVKRIEDITKRPVHRVKVSDVDSVARARISRPGPDEISMFRPTVKPVQPERLPPQALETRHEAERSDMRERHRAQQRELREYHRRGQSLPGVSPDEVRRRHHAERRALLEQQKQEGRILQWRQQQERRIPERPQPGQRPPQYQRGEPQR